MSTPSFGVAMVGKSFDWNIVTDDLDDNGDPVIETRTFRARSGITFDEVLEYRAILAELQISGQLLVQTLKRRGEAIDGEKSAERSVDEIRTELADLSDQSQEHERKRWERIIDQTLLLVHPPHREELRPLLEQGDYQSVVGLRNWLTEEVMGRAEDQAEATGGVDPTLPPPPPDSPPSETGGDDSDNTESSSTDSPTETPSS